MKRDHSFPSSGLGMHTLEALLPGPCIRPTHALSPRSRRDGLPVSAGRRSRASGTLVSKLELGNEGERPEKITSLRVVLLTLQLTLASFHGILDGPQLWHYSRSNFIPHLRKSNRCLDRVPRHVQTQLSEKDAGSYMRPPSVA